jgi:methyltransferase-like protein
MGGNLMAMAQKYPGARFVGIDLSSRQIAEGWKVIDRLKIDNVELRHMDIADVPESLGKFDYIVSHGVYSWVSPAVQDRMLTLVKRHLAPNGVAYISYNTFPGWHIRGIVRDMMLYRGMQFADPATRLAQAKSLVEFVAKSSPDAEDPYRKVLQGELDVLLRSDDYYLHHDHLEENNHPLHFHEFARRLDVNGLQYLGEADFSTMVSSNFAPDVARTLQDLGAHDIVQMEQYMDFVRCRYFRQTLICHGAAPLKRQLLPPVVKEFFLASQATPEDAEASAEAGSPRTYRAPGGRGITCRSAATMEALRLLRAAWPASIAFADLAARCTATADEDFLANEMLAGMAAGVVEWRVSPDPFVTAVPPRPEATARARSQAATGNRITNLRDETVTLDEIHRTVLQCLDGQRDIPAIVDAVGRFIRDGGHQLTREHDRAVVTEPAEQQQLLGEALDRILGNLAAKALIRRPQ